MSDNRGLYDRNPLFFVFLIPVIVDVVGTVFGQPAAYWTSHYQTINEAAPVYPLLHIHPAVFIVVTLGGWLSFTYYLTWKLRPPFNIWAAMALFGGHMYNSVNWLRLIQKNHGILAGGNHLVVTLSLLPMITYILVAGFVAAKAIGKYYASRSL